jgi:hypothetical protein
VFGWNRDTHVHLVRHQVPFDNLAFLLLRHRVEDRSLLLARFAEDYLAASFRHKHHMILAVPLGLVSKPVEEDLTPATVKPFLVSLVEPVAYQFQLFTPLAECYPQPDDADVRRERLCESCAATLCIDPLLAGFSRF